MVISHADKLGDMHRMNFTNAIIHHPHLIRERRMRLIYIRTAEFSHRLCTQNSEPNIPINRKRLGVTLRSKKVYIFVQQYVWFEADVIRDVFHMNFLINFPINFCTQILVRNNSETT